MKQIDAPTLIVAKSTAYNSTVSRSTVSESLCLDEGSYEFTVFDSDGICCLYGDGQYNLTSNGNVIAQGGEFTNSETTVFFVPI